MSFLRSAGPRVSVFALCLAGAAAAQDLRPGDRRPELPEPAEAQAPVPLGLPPLEEPGADPALSSGIQVRVERFEFSGNTAFASEVLAATVAPFTGRLLGTEDLLAARDAVTRLYVEAGYLTSGAVVPDQSVSDGVVQLRIVESELGKVEVRGNRRFRDGYFASRLLRAGRAPLRVETLESALRLLQRDPRIERVDAVLEPGSRRGESRLVLTVSENLPLALGLELGNGRSPAVGSRNLAGSASVYNLAGWGDSLTLHGEYSEGVRDLGLRAETPLGPWDTRAAFYARRTWVEIVERPFDALEIESQAQTLGVELAHPLWRDADDEVWILGIGEHRQLDTEVLGEDFCFEPDPGLDASLVDCRGPRATVLRAGLEWTRRSARDVVALRSLLSVGVDLFGATTHSDRDLADGRFVAWLAQLQWARVLPESWLDAHLSLRADLQLASESLLSFERFASGGRTTVRGYRENQLVTDSGVIGSAELRVPLLRDPLGRHLLELIPFTDLAHGWNQSSRDPEDDLLWSAGAGLRLRPAEQVLLEAWWGGQLLHVSDPGRALQDHGVHLRLRVDVP